MNKRKASRRHPAKPNIAKLPSRPRLLFFHLWEEDSHNQPSTHYNRIIGEEHIRRTLQGMETDSDDELDAVVKQAYAWMSRAVDSNRSGLLMLPPGYGVMVAVEQIHDMTLRDVVAAEIVDARLPEPPKDPNADPPRDDDDDPQR